MSFRFALATVALLLAPLSGSHASEEDHALIQEISLTARSTSEAFGEVRVSARVAKDTYHLEQLEVTIQGKSHVVPAEKLSAAGGVDLSAMRVSSEAGYPDKGFGPSLYVTFPATGDRPRTRFTFAPDGFRE